MPEHLYLGVLPMRRAGWADPQIMRELGISHQQLMHEMSMEIDDEFYEQMGYPVFGVPATKGG